ncbi:hypothetical protein, partial [Streptomyces xanthochromogenes]
EELPGTTTHPAKKLLVIQGQGVHPLIFSDLLDLVEAQASKLGPLPNGLDRPDQIAEELDHSFAPFSIQW